VRLGRTLNIMGSSPSGEEETPDAGNVEHESEFPALKLEMGRVPILYSSIQIVHQIGFPFHDAMRVGQASHPDESNGI